MSYIFGQLCNETFIRILILWWQCMWLWRSPIRRCIDVPRGLTLNMVCNMTTNTRSPDSQLCVTFGCVSLKHHEENNIMTQGPEVIICFIRCQWIRIKGNRIKGNRPNNMTVVNKTLQWRHNDHDVVSNQQPHGCLLNRYSGADQRKHQSSASLTFVRGIHRDR